jgi:hypothetical protein
MTTSKSTIRILFLAANPNEGRLDLEREARGIQSKIRLSESRNIEFITRWAVRPDDLQQILLEVKPHIVHFSGHGTSEESLVFVDDDGNPQYVSTKALEHLFSTLKDDLKLVVLNACFSVPQAKAITKSIGSTIGMRREIGDEAAIVFAGALYQALGFHRSIGDAFELGRNALLLLAIPEEKTPVLLLGKGVSASDLIIASEPMEKPVLASQYAIFSKEELLEIISAQRKTLKVLLQVIEGFPEGSAPTSKLVEIQNMKDKILAVQEELESR